MSEITHTIEFFDTRHLGCFSGVKLVNLRSEESDAFINFHANKRERNQRKRRDYAKELSRGSSEGEASVPSSLQSLFSGPITTPTPQLTPPTSHPASSLIPTAPKHAVMSKKEIEATASDILGLIGANDKAASASGKSAPTTTTANTKNASTAASASASYGMDAEMARMRAKIERTSREKQGGKGRGIFNPFGTGDSYADRRNEILGANKGRGRGRDKDAEGGEKPRAKSSSGRFQSWSRKSRKSAENSKEIEESDKEKGEGFKSSIGKYLSWGRKKGAQVESTPLEDTCVADRKERSLSLPFRAKAGSLSRKLFSKDIEKKLDQMEKRYTEGTTTDKEGMSEGSSVTSDHFHSTDISPAKDSMTATERTTPTWVGSVFAPESSSTSAE